MGKLGDIFVRLGLKKDDFDRGIDQSKTKLQGFSSKIKSFKAGALAIWSAVGVGLIKLADNFAHASQRFGDQWDNTMARMKSAWSQFLTALTEWDWDGFGKRVAGAMNAAGQSQQAHDAEFEVENSIKLRKAAIREELAQLQIQMRNQKLSYEERIKAAEEYLNKLKPIYDEEIKLRNKIKFADMNEYLANAGVNISNKNRENLETFLTQVAPNDELLDALDRNSRRTTGDLKLGEIYTQKDDRLVEEFLKQYEGDYQTQAAFEMLARYYKSSSDDKAKKVVDAIEAAYAAEAAFAEETRRVQQIKNSADASSSTDGSKTEAPSQDVAEKNKAEKIYKSSQDSAKSKLKLLRDNYEEEKALLEKYGLDTTALTKKYWKESNSITKEYINDIANSLKDLKPVELDLIDVDTSGVNAEIQRLKDELDMSDVDTSGVNAEIQRVLNSAEDNANAKLKILSENYESEKALLEKYGLDTTALTDKYWKENNDIIQAYLNDITAALENIEPIELDMVDVDMSDVDAEIQRFIDELEASRMRAEEAVNAFGNAVANGFADSCQVLMESLFGLQDFNGGAVVKALLDPLADLAMSAGAIIMAEGIATLAAKSALETFGATGWGAVAAGAALIAAGAAAKAGLAALANKGSTSTAMPSSSASSSSNKTQTVESEMTIYVTGRISGSDILISGQRTADSWAR